MQESVIGKKLAKELPELAALSPQTEPLTEKDALWLKAEGVRSFMVGQRHILYVYILAIPTLFVALYGQVNETGLWAWTIATLLLFSYRFWLTKDFEKNTATWGDGDVLKFRAKNAWTWSATAAMWGALVWLFYAKSPLLVQFIVWVSLIFVGVFGAIGYVGHLKTLKNFINTLVIVCLLGMFWASYSAIESSTITMTIKLTPLVLVLWMMLIMIGIRLNEAFTQRMMLRMSNIALIDSLKAQTQRAVSAIETKNRFLASAAHDIRQPVLALDLYANLLRSDPLMAADLTPKITVATRSVVAMFDSLFDLSRLETGQIKIVKTQVDVAIFMHELLLQYQPAASLKGLELRIRTCQAQIETDPQLLKRVIGNLIANAIKFTEKQGVLLACRKTQNGVRFEVWDTGLGIALEQQQAVFQEFYKVPLAANAPLGTNDGFGLGLSIVARFCESLGHTFSMRSTVGQGSVFSIDVVN